jgi:hypothetical protein
MKPVDKNGNKYQQLPLSSIVLEDSHQYSVGRMG